MTITRVQAEALAAFVCRVREDWRQAGVVAAILKCENEHPLDIARALVNLAAEPNAQTPGLLHGPGPHWRKPDGTTTARKGDHDMRCTEHPTEVVPCRTCNADPAKRRGTPDDFANLRAVLDEATRAAREEAAARSAS